MLEEKNDNLQNADGNVNNESNEVTTVENQEIDIESRAKRFDRAPGNTRFVRAWPFKSFRPDHQ